MGASTTQNTDMKRTYRKGDQRIRNEAAEVWNGTEWIRGSQRKGQPDTDPATKTLVENTAKAPTAADLEDNPSDSPLVRASKRRQRTQRDAMKLKSEK